MATQKKVKSKKKACYWAVKQSGLPHLYEGTFLDCWNYFAETYAKLTMAGIVKRGIFIGRCR